MEEICGNGHMETWKKQLLINISEILAEKGLLSDEEMNRMKILVSNNGK